MRLCAVCYTKVDQLGLCTLTAHEFNCYKRAGVGAVPSTHIPRYQELLKWEKRSNTAKKATVKRKRK